MTDLRAAGVEVIADEVAGGPHGHLNVPGLPSALATLAGDERPAPALMADPLHDAAFITADAPRSAAILLGTTIHVAGLRGRRARRRDRARRLRAQPSTAARCRTLC